MFDCHGQLPLQNLAFPNEIPLLQAAPETVRTAGGESVCRDVKAINMKKGEYNTIMSPAMAQTV